MSAKKPKDKFHKSVKKRKLRYFKKIKRFPVLSEEEFERREHANDYYDNWELDEEEYERRIREDGCSPSMLYSSMAPCRYIGTVRRTPQEQKKINKMLVEMRKELEKQVAEYLKQNPQIKE